MKIVVLAMALVGAVTSASAEEVQVRYPYRVEGACPFECCDYGTWTARSDIPVFSAERTRIAPAFTIRKGEEFEAVLDASMYDAPDSDYEIAKARPATATEWWIEVKSAGRSGWFERGTYPIDGSDRCE